MTSKAFPLLAVLGLLATTLAFVPAASAQPSICPTPITVGSAIECAVDKTVTAIRSVEATITCVLGVPPSTYPNGLGACLAIAPLLEPTLP